MPEDDDTKSTSGIDFDSMMEHTATKRVTAKQLDPALWGVRPTALSPTVHLNTFVQEQLVNLVFENRQTALEIFVEEFAGWTEAMFGKVHRDLMRQFIRTIRTKGIYLRGSTNAKSLVDLLNNPDGTWPDDIPREYRDVKSLNDWVWSCPKQELVPPTFDLPPKDAPRSTPGGSGGGSGNNPPDGDDDGSDSGSNGGGGGGGPGQGRPDGKNNKNKHDFDLDEFDKLAVLPPPRTENIPLDPYTAANLGKHIRDSEMYTGDPYDILDDKILLFYDACRNLHIKPQQLRAALPYMLTGTAKEFYIESIARQDTFEVAYFKLKARFDTDDLHRDYHTDWNTMTFGRFQQKYPEKDKSEVLDLMLRHMRKCYRALGYRNQDGMILRDNLLRAVRDVPEFNYALITASTEPQKLESQLRQCLAAAKTQGASRAYNTAQWSDQTYQQEHSDAVYAQGDQDDYGDDFDDQYYSDRRYNDRRPRYPRPPFRNNFGPRRNFPSNGSRGNFRGNYGSGGYRNGNSYRPNTSMNGGRDGQPRKKKCFVCQKEGCWSTNHPSAERQRAKAFYVNMCEESGQEITDDDFHAFLVSFEGINFDGSEPQTMMVSVDEEKSKEHHVFLMDQAFLHGFAEEASAPESPEDRPPAETFTIEDRYSRQQFQGIMPDTGAATFSTTGYEQFMALQRKVPGIEMDTTRAGEARIKFGPGRLVESLGTVLLDTPAGQLIFHVVKTATPFLMCVQDMNKHFIYFRNITDEVVQLKPDWNAEKTFPVVWKWGHPWFFTNGVDQDNAMVCLTDVELRRLHRRFGHPSVDRLSHLLKGAGHTDVDASALEAISKFCHHCQLHSSAPQRFKFNLKDDVDFNYEIIVDIMYLLGLPVLHVVDLATSFQAGRFVASLSTKDAWEALRQCWIDTYLGPPDRIVHDAGTNFASTEFRSTARIMGITCKQVPTEAHWSIGKVERYHAPLRRAFDILHAELSGTYTKEAILQATFKAVNDTVGPNGIVPTLLVFGAYPRLTEDSAPTPSSLKRAAAVQKAMKELRKVQAERQINAALGTRNGPDTTVVLDLPLQSEVRVWREKHGWQGPYKLLATDGHDLTLDLPNGPTVFRSTLVQPYYRDVDEDQVRSVADPDEAPDEPIQFEPDPVPAIQEPEQPRRRGRPKGSKNKPREVYVLYLTQKEIDNYELSLKLRRDGVITTPGDPFEESDSKEITELIANGVLKFELYDPNVHGDIHIFKSRVVREVKGKNEKPYEKSRLVVAGCNDRDKTNILTQSPTIQRASQRLLLVLAPSLIREGYVVQLRDVTQAYPQSKTELMRVILCHLPPEIRDKYPPGTIMRVVKPLYGVAESGLHWWATYQKFHAENLDMITSAYDPCLWISSKKEEDGSFSITAMQTDDTLQLNTPAFSAKENEEIKKADIRCKEKETLTPEKMLNFNGTMITMASDGSIKLQQKGQGTKIAPVNAEDKNGPQQYMEQRARGAYLACICQPEAAFDLSAAAQVQDPKKEDFDKLNRRLQWQAEHLDRGLRYIPLDLPSAKLMIFVDGSFANNKDLSSQIGFVIALVNEEASNKDAQCTVRGNIVHWSSTKCKRVTRSVLASEIYGMVNGFDMGVVMAATLRQITSRLEMPDIPLVVCTDSYSLYECLVKLGTTKEKRLMIDVMALRQSYERREISEIRWITGDCNPADAFTKGTPNKTLEHFVSTNEITIKVQGHVDRGIVVADESTA